MKNNTLKTIPQTYYSPRYNQTYEVQIIPVKPHWSCSALGAKFRCLIGTWNFNCTYFVDQAQANGKTELEAYECAIRLCETEIIQGNEDVKMLGE